MRDNNDDDGGVPSALGGRSFWESPDIFLVPTGEVPDPNAISSETLVTADGVYDIYLRVHNTYGCRNVSGVRAAVLLADPSALSANWQAITPTTAGGSLQYVTAPNSPFGLAVGPGTSGLLGPFTFDANLFGIGDGHKCLLAAISSESDPAPTNPFDAPASSQVAQRNVQGAYCQYPLTNATVSDASLTLSISVSPVIPSLAGMPGIWITFNDGSLNWHDAWSGQPGVEVTTDSDGNTVVRLGAANVGLTNVTLPAGQSRTASIAMDLPADAAADVSIRATLTNPTTGKKLVSNGGTCHQDGMPPGE